MEQRFESPSSVATSPVEVTRHDGVAWLRLDRPDRLNSLTLDVMDIVSSTITDLECDPDVRAIVLTGTGRAFSVGLDADLLTRGFADRDYFAAALERFAGLLSRIEHSPLPVVAAVNGLARAGGLEIALACDLVVAAADARIGDVHTTFAVPPGGGASVRLARHVGPQRATELIMSGRWLSGEEAARIGLVLEAVPAAELEAAVSRLLAGMVDKSPRCLAVVKQMLRRDDDAALAREREVFLDYLFEPDSDAQEGFAAWQQSRKPRWAR